MCSEGLQIWLWNLSACIFLFSLFLQLPFRKGWKYSQQGENAICFKLCWSWLHQSQAPCFLAVLRQRWKGQLVIHVSTLTVWNKMPELGNKGESYLSSVNSQLANSQHCCLLDITEGCRPTQQLGPQWQQLHAVPLSVLCGRWRMRRVAFITPKSLPKAYSGKYLFCGQNTSLRSLHCVLHIIQLAWLQHKWIPLMPYR